MISTSLSTSQLKSSLIELIQENETFKKYFIKNPEKALESQFGLSTLDTLLIDINRDTCGLLHIKISDRNNSDNCNDFAEDNNYIHLIMLDSK